MNDVIRKNNGTLWKLVLIITVLILFYDYSRIREANKYYEACTYVSLNMTGKLTTVDCSAVSNIYINETVIMKYFVKKYDSF